MVSDRLQGVYIPRPHCLNPCSNGIWSLTGQIISPQVWIIVLILVLMEYGLWPLPRRDARTWAVSLNPCSNGIWSLTFTVMPIRQIICVLILVLMEYGLWRRPHVLPDAVLKVLILVLMEYGLWRLDMFPLEVYKRVLILVLMEYGLWRWRQTQLIRRLPS